MAGVAEEGLDPIETSGSVTDDEELPVEIASGSTLLHLSLDIGESGRQPGNEVMLWNSK